MPIHNNDVAGALEQIADLLEINDENAFRIRAYRNAARTVGNLSENVADMVESGRNLTELSGVGKDLAGKIETIVKTGSLPLLEDPQKQMPADLVTIMKIPGLGGKRVHAIHKQLGIDTLDELEQAAREGKLRALGGLGEKTEHSILEGISQVRKGQERRRWAEAEETVATLLDYLRKSSKVKQVLPAGSFRRRRETIGDVDVLATCGQGSNIMDRFVKYDEVQKVVSQGDTRSTVVLRSGLQVDLRVVPQVSYGAALHYFTGSQAHNIAVRKLGVQKKLKINEYGIFKGDKRVGGRKEEEVFDAVDLPYIEPELREDRGEIQAARKGKLPKLVTVDDIRGDLHTHTNNTDGKATLQEMVDAARKRGYRYLAITDHSQRLTVARGLDKKRLKKLIDEIDTLNGTLSDFRVLKGIELDILDNGKLDLPDDILKELDLTVCSVHSKFKLSRREQTERIVRAMDNRYFTILGHPTGRMINERPPYDIDMEQIIRAAHDRGCFLEVNGQPERLDLSDTYCKAAKEAGVKLSVATDAHSTSSLDFIRHAVGQARRGWVEADDVINTRNLRGLLKLISQRR
ncbi:MAG: DNA polymerase/3'-5' exonuclease PolX [Chitinivibrionales bacterium]|nr:DNA polymerase/3'-5' exonuclease PolX [Chitinivibrionales bacterium]